MRKLEWITDLYRQTVKEITKDSTVWCAFLQSAAFQYKYPFADQVLIYAQRPNATACAELQLWNRYFGRRVKRGSTGIALITDSGGRQGLRYVFDVGDTYHREGQPFSVWSVKPEYTDEIESALENRYGDLPQHGNLQNSVMLSCAHAVEDHLADYFENLAAVCSESRLGALSEQEQKATVTLLLTSGVTYTVFARLGWDANLYIGQDIFRPIAEFNTPDTVSCLGCAVSDISEMCLRDIESVVKACEKKCAKEIRTFDKTGKTGYNEGTQKTNDTGGQDHDLQDRERNVLFESEIAGATGKTARKVRHDALGLSDEASQRDLHYAFGAGEAERASVRDRAEREKADRNSDRTDGEATERDRTDEADRSDAMDSDDELDQGIGGGGSVEQPDLRVDQPNAAIRNGTLPPIADSENLIQILRHGNYLRKSKEEIVSFLCSEAGEEQKTEYIKNAYPPLQFSEFFKAGTEQHLGYRADNDGLLLYDGKFPSRTAETRMDWAFVRSLIEALIQDGNYLDEPVAKEILQSLVTDQFPESEYDLKLGATVHIGKDEMELLSLSNDKVELFNGTLFPLEMNPETFLRRIRENPLNDSLKKQPDQSLLDTLSDEEIAERLPENGLEIVRLLESRSLENRFLIDKGRQEVVWRCFDAHSVTGGLLIERWIPFEAILRVGRQASYEDFFNLLEEEGQRSASSVSDGNFRDVAVAFLTEKPDCKGFCADSMHFLVAEIAKFEMDRLQEFNVNLYIQYIQSKVAMPGIPTVIVPDSWEGREVHAIAWFLREAKRTDIQLSYTEDEITGSDGIHLWQGKEFYSFLLNDLAKLNRNCHVSNKLGIDQDTVDSVIEFATTYGWDIEDAYPEITQPVAKEPKQSDQPKQAKKRKSKKPTVESLVQSIEAEYDSWDYYMNGGGSDPSWEDGYNLNLIRRHILYYRNQLLELCPAGQLPEIFQKAVPDEVPNTFMAVPDQIRENAKRTLAVLQANETYLWCKEKAVLIPEKLLQKSVIPNILGCVSGLEKAIENDRLVEMRRYQKPDSYVERFERCKEEIEQLLPQIEQEQLRDTIFTFLTDADTKEQKNNSESSDSPQNHSEWKLYQQIKKKFPNHIAMVRAGDFYEFFDQDAITASKVLDLTLTSRAIRNGDRVPMCGIPLHMEQEYLKKLLDAGYQVAIDGGVNGSPVLDKRSDDPELERAKQYISDFCRDEYQTEKVDFSDLGKIGIAYTTIDDEIPIQVDVDLKQCRLEKYLGETKVGSEQYSSLKELNDQVLSCLDFDELVAVSVEEVEQYRKSQHFITATSVHDSQLEEPAGEKQNYRIADDEIGMGGAKEKFRKNIAAVNLLHELELDNRLANPEEQEILAQYSGWGGLADAFDENKENWASEFQELYTALSPEEYKAARESTLTAFYTPPVVIKAMYQALENMGFKCGNVLEPSCGVGNFMGLVPNNMDARFYGVELDSLSGKIAKQLYQKNNILINGFEKTQFPDSFFDAVIGNVPFGQFKVVDKKYDKYNFLIHDYFFAKALDQVRPGGVIAFITSSGTLDKENPSVRKYLAQRAELLGAIRLPDNTFRGAGTRVVSDIIFLQKRDRPVDIEPDWVHLGKDENGIPMNQYFVDHPDMILGETIMGSGPFGPEPTCKAYDGKELGELLAIAVGNIRAEILETEIEDLAGEEESCAIPADPNVKNFSYALVDGRVYYRQNSIMTPVEISVTGEKRIKGMIGIRDTVRKLIDAQLADAPDGETKTLQIELNQQYDRFTAKYGLINSRANASVFSDDSSYFLLCSLEILDENKELQAKADMFTKRTIKPQVKIDRVDTASEALAVSIGERAKVDISYMSALTGKSEEELLTDLNGVIFLNPAYGEKIGAHKYLTADEYLSGNVREKLKEAKEKAEADEAFLINAEALEKVQPADLTASEIGVRLGSTWVPEEDIQAFIFELFTPSLITRYRMKVKYIGATGQWVITEKNCDRDSVKANSTYGTTRINGYAILEDTLNLKDVRIMDYFEDENGRRKAVLNKKETMIAQGKQEQIKRAFEEWIWKDPVRRERLCRFYNEKFNSIRPREYDGSHIRYFGMNPEIMLRRHQTNAVARILYGGNSLLAHTVGAGKTFTMVAAAQEMKRLGLCHKSMFVVPNHLIEQWASEYLQLYPSANILVTTKKDFETKNRKKFCARIATGDYDAVIIGHSQFEKIPMSVQRQIQTIETEIDAILLCIADAERDPDSHITVKQLERVRKQLETKLEKLNDQSRKDDVVTFEELGIDRLFVDEAHSFKNLAAYSKMRNVAGISQTEAQKSSDLYMKCRYLDELTGGKGVIFATGTPISNSMVELYTMQKYLQYSELEQKGLLNFDSWASTFGETVSSIELAPDGTGYRTKTRFARFYNIPELIAMFKQVADVQTADMLKLPVPEAHYHVVNVKASENQKNLVQSFAARAEKIHSGRVKSDRDNMLLITNDGRKVALDQRLYHPLLPDFEGSKVNVCIQNVYDTWKRTFDRKSSQLLFCDLSTPKGDGSFNVYDDVRCKLIGKGIPQDEIAFIHTADTDAKKKDLFAKVRNGKVRILLGSTQKMGAGTNVQRNLIALHDLDVPWRPADLEQRAGRIVRQGNENPAVDLYRYVTEGTFDSYSYQLLETKQKFISQIMTSKSPVRVAEDIDDIALSYAEIKAISSGNPKIMEKMQLDVDVAKLKFQKADHLSQRYNLEDQLLKHFPNKIAEVKARIKGLEADMEVSKNNTFQNDKGFSPMVVMDKTYTEKAEAGKAILEFCENMTDLNAKPLGEYRGFKTDIGFDGSDKEFYILLKGNLSHQVPLGQDANGIITRLDNAIEKFQIRKETCETELFELQKQVESAKAEIATPFPREAELEEKCERLAKLNAELNMDRKENELVDDGDTAVSDAPVPEKACERDTR